MSDPLRPNYKPGVGRLVTDRFDFQKHVDGVDFNHHSSGIQLFPTVVINDSPRSNVQDAIEQLALNLTPPVVPDATASVKGIIKLSGDIGGTANSVTVTRIQNKPVSSLAPAVNDLLSWDGTSWTPGSNATLNNLGATTSTIGTLVCGTGTIININSLTANLTNINAAGTLTFTTFGTMVFANTNATRIISCEDATTGDGQDFQIIGQGTSDVLGAGGNVRIDAGSTTGGPFGGSVIIQGGNGVLLGGAELKLGDGTAMLHATHVDTSPITRRVLGLVSNTSVDNTQMPLGTGDMVMFLANANVNPSSTASPVGGSIIYSSGGQVHIRQSNNLDITLGPETWGRVAAATSGKMETYSVIQTSTDFNRVTLTTFAVPNHTVIYVEAYIVGKVDGSAVSYSTKLSGSYVNEGGTAVEATFTDGYYFGNNTERLKRVTPDTDLWFGPTITLAGTSVTIKTGSNGAAGSTTITWFGIIKIITGPSFTTP